MRVPLANASFYKSEKISLWSNPNLRHIIIKYYYGAPIQNLSVPYMFETKWHSMLKLSYLFIVWHMQGI